MDLPEGSIVRSFLSRALRAVFGAIRADRRAVSQLVTTGTLMLAAASLAAAQDAIEGLPYTAITPCRIADTRNMAAGPIKAGGTRIFHGAGPASFADQGGSATDCGVASLPSVR